ncbi:MAG: hypothetical protein JRG91_01725, partial [Deltaproteobacteria bacterium]|nr:hypothetical protein [Deltaproteobacteria bacterium]
MLGALLLLPTWAHAQEEDMSFTADETEEGLYATGEEGAEDEGEVAEEGGSVFDTTLSEGLLEDDEDVGDVAIAKPTDSEEIWA